MLNRKNIIQIIGKSFESWWKNFSIVLPFIFETIISSILIVIAILFIVPSVFNIGLQDLITINTNQDAISQKILSALQNPAAISTLITIIAVFVLITLILIAYFHAGATGMALEYLNSKNKTGLKKMNLYGKKFFFRYFILSLMVSIIFLALAAAFFLPAFLSNGAIVYIILFIVGFFILIFLYLFISLSFFILIVKDCSIFSSIRQSFVTVGKNFWAFLGLSIIFAIARGLIQSIPYVGWIAYILIVNPVLTYSFVIFVQERA